MTTALRATRMALAHASLERLVEQRGDAVRDVMERYYRAMPEARHSFLNHGLGDVDGLEARMVSESFFLLLRWVEEPRGTSIDQATTIVHHNDTLEIGPRWYMGLVDAALAVLLETVPSGAHGEREMWHDVRAEIARFIDRLRPEFLRNIDPQPLASTQPS